MVLVGYGLLFMLLQLAARGLAAADGTLYWYYPSALSLALLMVRGPRLWPVVALAPLPLGLLFRSPELPAWLLVATAVAYAGGHALAVMGFRRMGLSARLQRGKDVAGFLLLAFLGPCLASLPLLGLWKASVLPQGIHAAEYLRVFLMSDALGVLTLGPVLLLWGRPLLTLGWTRLRRKQPPGRLSLLPLQGLALLATCMVVVAYSQPGTLHLKYLLFLPMTWVAFQGGLLGASLAFPALSLMLTVLVRRADLPPDALLGTQSFLTVLFGMALFLGASRDGQTAAQGVKDRRRRNLHHLMESTGAIPWELDLNTGRCRYLGPKAEATFGWPLARWHAQPYWGEVVHPDDRAGLLRFLSDMDRAGSSAQMEFRLLSPTGGEHWVRVAGGLEARHGQGHVGGFLFDIQAHKRAEENALLATLKEKDLLLREIHHRVKNNLQVVSSLLRLQAASQSDPAVHLALQEAQERVQAIALIHQKLKHAPDLSQLDLPGYVRSLAERLVRTYASVPTLIDLQVRVADVEMNPEAPVPLGLILNELVTNALQHAFPPGQGGGLDIEIGPYAETWIYLRVADTGQGLPDGVDLKQGGLGFQLVLALADQLGGLLELERRRGASFLLTFPSFPARP